MEKENDKIKRRVLYDGNNFWWIERVNNIKKTVSYIITSSYRKKSKENTV